MRGLNASAKLLAVFGFSFVLNFLWEHAHYVLYAHYKGGPITSGILLHATVVDAVIITLVGASLCFVPYLRQRGWLPLFILVLVAVGIELWALNTGRWAYQATMPLLPLIDTGLSPTMQLALTGWLSFTLSIPGYTLFLQRCTLR